MAMWHDAAYQSNSAELSPLQRVSGMLSFQACSLSGSLWCAAPWEGEGCVGLDGGWIGLSRSWQENRSPTGVEKGKWDLKLC